MPAEEIEFYEILGDMLVNLGRSYTEIQEQRPVRLTIDGHEVAVDPLKPRTIRNEKNVFAQLTTIYDAARSSTADSAKTNADPDPVPSRAHEARGRVPRLRGRGDDQDARRPHADRAGPGVLSAGDEQRRGQDTQDEPPRAQNRPHGDRAVARRLPAADRRPASISTANELAPLAGARARSRHAATASRGRRPTRQRRLVAVIAVDHNACILCDRCVRACNDIRDNHVIGRMGKGYADADRLRRRRRRWANRPASPAASA